MIIRVCIWFNSFRIAGISLWNEALFQFVMYLALFSFSCGNHFQEAQGSRDRRKESTRGKWEMEDKRSAVAEACKAKKALKYLHHFLSDILTFIELIWKEFSIKINPEKYFINYDTFTKWREKQNPLNWSIIHSYIRTYRFSMMLAPSHSFHYRVDHHCCNV